MGRKHSAYDSSKPIDWALVAGDIRRYRKGQISRDELREKYPKLWIRDDAAAADGYREGIFFTIHRSCPFKYAIEIAYSTVAEDADVCCATCEMSLKYREEWSRLPSVGYMTAICEAKKDVHFKCQITNGELTLSHCVEEGEYWRDEGWYSVDPDIWLRATLNSKGEWVKPFAIEK